MLTVLLASACGSQGTQSSIDIDRLDTGNFATSPIDIETLRTPTSGVVREAIRIGEATPLAMEYDARFGYAPIQPARSNRVTLEEPPYFNGTGIESKQFAVEVPGLVAGWRMYANRRDELGQGRSIETFTLRFKDSHLAKNAAEKLMLRSEGEVFDGFEDHPGVLAKITQTDSLGVTTLRAFHAVNDMLVAILISDPVSRPFDPIENTQIVQRYLDRQLALLKEFTATPIADLDKLPLDTEGLLAKTLRRDPPRPGAAVYPAHAALGLAERPAALSAAFADSGVDYVAISGATIYRARDEAAAARLIVALEKGAFNARGLVDAAGPENLPVAHCYELDPNLEMTGVNSPRCIAPVGRYAISVVGANLQEVRQRISAQYKLLAITG
ncbi:hypothetical protein FEK33_19690 [Nocardia asteroides NBRC 15531]|uniref:DUF7373 family lipoprotein n=1 Tax=Nocardia asteroides TaxID=1824 RepID=UPI000F82B115|nr:hypothetical protein [Nocardia asteroides]TLF65530.1 hypothetical protein FEK33_19690 [Nocardia asteroides NBRC 15531]UGT47711.1 hypothetical protein LT345_24935 [Nocardia asteroides]